MSKIHHWLYIIAIAIVIAGSLNWGLIALNPNYNILNVIPENRPFIKSFVMGIIGICAIYVSLQQTTYLPFLGECVVPIFNFLNDYYKRTNSIKLKNTIEKNINFLKNYDFFNKFK